LRDPVPPADNKTAGGIYKSMDRNSAYWFAIHTQALQVKQGNSFLKEKRVDSLLPLVKILSQRRKSGEFVCLSLSLPGCLLIYR